MSCVRVDFARLCLDLNLDVETRERSWKSYEEIRRHYLLEGDQLQWLAVSLYICCRRGEDEENEKRKSSINPISLSRLLRSSNHFSLMSFFVKLHQWEDMSNLPDYLRRQIDRLEKGFRFSSCLFHKYPSMFSQIFRSSSNLLVHCQSFRREQINPKFHRTKKSSLIEDLFFVSWTVFSLSKTLYRSTFHDLTASFHLLIASLEYLSQLTRQFHLSDLLVSLPSSSSDYPVIEHLCRVFNGREDIATNIFEEHFPKDLFSMTTTTNPSENLCRYIRHIDRCYDEIILRECLIDERIFFDGSNQFVDLLDSFNENRNQKTSLQRTPLTAEQFLLPPSSSSPILQGLTPISQTKQFIEQLFNIIGEQQQSKPSQIILDLLQQTYLGSSLLFSPLLFCSSSFV